MQTFDAAETARKIWNFEIMTFACSLEELKQVAGAINSLKLTQP